MFEPLATRGGVSFSLDLFLGRRAELAVPWDGRGDAGLWSVDRGVSLATRGRLGATPRDHTGTTPARDSTACTAWTFAWLCGNGLPARPCRFRAGNRQGAGST